MWCNKDTCFYKLTESEDKPFIGFDFDDTLVKLRTDQVLPQVKQTLTKLSLDYNLVIFSNQMGVSKKKCTHEFVRNNFESFLSQVNLSISVFYSTGSDTYRKPNPGMYNLFQQMFHADLQWYCGDACGRRKDFSNSDLYFANNCEIQFKTPEHVFQSQPNTFEIVKRSELYTDDHWVNGFNENKDELFDTQTVDISLPTSKKVMVVMVGPQGSGKSTLANHISKQYNLQVVSSDEIPSKAKLKRTLKQYIQSETKGIVIDNTNASHKNRKEWYDLVDDTWTKVIVHINIPKQQSMHLVQYREMYTNKHIPAVAIHSYYKRYETPTEEEGHIIDVQTPVVNHTYNHRFRF